MNHFSIYRKRRQVLSEQMGSQSIAIFIAREDFTRELHHSKYHQESNFYYLTGCKEHSVVGVLIPGREQGEFVVFCRPKNKDDEIWDGKMIGLEGAKSELGADEAMPMSELSSMLPQLLKGRSQIYYDFSQDATHQLVKRALDTAKAQERKSQARLPAQFCDIAEILHEMRVIKDAHELSLMRRSAQIAAQSHIAAMQAAKPGIGEYELEAQIQGVFLRNAAHLPAYSSIVGSGENACILHYVENSEILKDGDLVLIDAGCDYEHYASDITRTFPINGQFNPEQKAIYEIVLQAQQDAISAVRPGGRYEDIHQAAVKTITEGLVDLGLLVGEINDLICEGSYKKFFMHGTGHWLGLDVHDAGRYKVEGVSRPLQAGMVLTVEPGIYVQPDETSVDAKWRGIGVRIEDDVLVTDLGCEVLSADVPKTIEEIEALMAETATV